MLQTIKSVLEKTRTSIWPIPAAIAIGSLVLSQVVVQLDKLPVVRRFSEKFLSISHSSVETILTTIAGSVISVGGIVFSVTMVAMTLASGQFGPKILREYLGNRSSKLTLGLFIGTFIYCIITLLSFKTLDRPGLNLIVGVGMAILSFFMFVHFIHKTAVSIQADRIVHDIAKQLQQDLTALAAEAENEQRQKGTAEWRKSVVSLPKYEITVSEGGYVESVGYSALAEMACEQDCYFKILTRAGHFVLPGQSICVVYGKSGDLDDEAVRDHIILGDMRTPVQDPEFAIVQLVQIAVRALSPGINDPGTAITCIDWLSAALARVVDSDLPNYSFCDNTGEVRVIGYAVNFNGLFSAMFLPLRQHSRGSLSVVLRILESLNKLAELTNRRERCDRISNLAEEIQREALADATSVVDKADIRNRIVNLRTTLNKPDVTRK